MLFLKLIKNSCTTHATQLQMFVSSLVQTMHESQHYRELPENVLYQTIALYKLSCTKVFRVLSDSRTNHNFKKLFGTEAGSCTIPLHRLYHTFVVQISTVGADMVQLCDPLAHSTLSVQCPFFVHKDLRSINGHGTETVRQNGAVQN